MIVIRHMYVRYTFVCVYFMSGGGFTANVSLAAPLAELLGADIMPRSQVKNMCLMEIICLFLCFYLQLIIQ